MLRLVPYRCAAGEQERCHIKGQVGQDLQLLLHDYAVCEAPEEVGERSEGWNRAASPQILWSAIAKSGLAHQYERKLQEGRHRSAK